MFKRLTSKQRAELSQPAKELLENKAFRAALDEVASKYYDVWEATDIRDVESREKIYMANVIIKQVKKHILTYANEGKLEQKSIVTDLKRR